MILRNFKKSSPAVLLRSELNLYLSWLFAWQYSRMIVFRICGAQRLRVFIFVHYDEIFIIAQHPWKKFQ